MMTPTAEVRQDGDNDEKGKDGRNNNNSFANGADPKINNNNDNDTFTAFNSTHDDAAGSVDSSCFQIRIKINDGKSTTDLTVSSISPTAMTVGQLKQRILDAKRRQQQQQQRQNNNEEEEESPRQYYLRLIVRGKMMAPDSTTLHQFGVVNNDVVHAVLLVMAADDDNDDGGKQKHGNNGSGGASLPPVGRGTDRFVDVDLGGGQRYNRREGPIVRVGGGQQARALRRLNNDALLGGMGVGGLVQRGPGGGDGGSRGGEGDVGASTPSDTWRSRQSLWRRIGIQASNNGNDDSGEEDEDDDDETNNEVDLEMGNNTTIRQESSYGRIGRRRSGRSAPSRERRGFDRLRSTGMSREEVMAIRSYFASSVDRYIERQRFIMRAATRSRRMRESRGDGLIVNGVSGSTNVGERYRRRTSTGESTNSLLDTTEDEDEVDGSGSNEQALEMVEGGRRSRENPATERGGIGGSDQTVDGAAGVTTSIRATATTTTSEREEILNDRPRMEDEWMAAQGPFSEFRMNLNTSNPLLMAAITSGGGFAVATGTGGPLDATSPLGLFSRSRNLGLYHGLVSNTDDGTGDDADEMFSGAFTSSGAFVHSNIGSHSAYRTSYAGPLPSAGTEKDFVWGFCLGFFVGFIMLFWVWMPSVPHRQKVGIILGISAQLGLNLLRKGGRGDDAM